MLCHATLSQTQDVIKSITNVIIYEITLKPKAALLLIFVAFMDILV